MTSNGSIQTKTNVLIIYTGGTIGMTPKDADNPASPLTPAPLDELLQYAPRLERIQSQIEIHYEAAFDTPLDSSNVAPLHWVEMARIIAKNYDKYDGFVILHGTDTMAFTASGLAFILNNLSKPVVITGSQLPISAIRTDAVQNLVSAIYLAGYKAFGIPPIPEVILCFSDRILRGCRATKVSTIDYIGFDSPNFPPLGSIGKQIKINEKLIRPMPEDGQNFFISEELAWEVMQKAEVLNIGLFPGFKASQLETMLNLPNVKGVVLRTFGAGNAPGDPEFLQAIDSAIHGESECLILSVTQCRKGMVEMGRYAASSGLLESGVLSGLDMTEEAAMAKLYWTLGTQLEGGRSEQLQISQRGEQSQNLFNLSYGKGGSEGQPVDIFRATKIPDYRLDWRKISRAVVRLCGVRIAGASIGDTITVRIFMNKPAATAKTPRDNERCVAELQAEWDGEALNFIQEIASRKTKTVISQGKIILSVVPQDGVKIWFDGLYLALFAEADY
ncbi:hypothetical protein CEE37_11595 [candidate division LCP-89 bacterium B3_LCP]|uniref:Asparaginase n=1 Tax=candidate division LCP-89 bacterium B3_LCP TaxID=2012998 RepID=A0A532UVW3_UNCL8|nr:MAG: hypothetical protein CEE37_11595 [candidate division LCP-89 bacterium B3_LCP]